MEYYFMQISILIKLGSPTKYEQRIMMIMLLLLLLLYSTLLQLMIMIIMFEETRKLETCE